MLQAHPSNALALDGPCGGNKHAGKLFSVVHQEDAGYVQWAVTKLAEGGASGWVEALAKYGQAVGVQPKQQQRPFPSRLNYAEIAQANQVQQPPQQQWQSQPPPAATRPAAEPPPPKRARPLTLPGQAPAQPSGWQQPLPQPGDAFAGATAPAAAPPMPVGRSMFPLSTAERSGFAGELIDVAEEAASLLKCYPEARVFWVNKCKAALKSRKEAELEAFECELDEGFKFHEPQSALMLKRSNALARAGDHGHLAGYAFDKIGALDAGWQIAEGETVLAAWAKASTQPASATTPRDAAYKAMLGREPAAAPDAPLGPRPWRQSNHFTVGKFSSNPDWSGKTFDDVYTNAPLKVWNWMLEKDSQCKWFGQFVDYARARAADEGREIRAPAKPPRLGGGR